MEKQPNISGAEWEIMKVLWNKSPVTANEVVERLADKQSWSPKTVKTLINRLVGKGAVGFEKNGRQYHYSWLLSESECVRAETRSFISRVRNSGANTLKPMLAAFLQEQELSAVEIEELKRILERKAK